MKHRSTREREEARMRLRYSAQRLKNLQTLLNRTGHGKDDPYRKTKLADFWDQVRYDKRLANGEI
jgi:hypothetical protein